MRCRRATQALPFKLHGEWPEPAIRGARSPRRGLPGRSGDHGACEPTLFDFKLARPVSTEPLWTVLDGVRPAKVGSVRYRRCPESSVATTLTQALLTWLEAEASAREIERNLAVAISCLDWGRAELLSRRFADQRQFCAEMLETTMQLMAERGPES